MTAADSACFACAGDGPRADRVRLLCPEHQAACRLSDGALLRAVLADASPPDGPLEGSLLGWLYNPVVVADRHGIERRGWADFVGGGMAVFEERFAAEQFFDVWLVARPDGIALLRSVRWGSSRDIADRLRAFDLSHQGLVSLARSMWLRGLAIQSRLEALGRWPESFAELREVLAEPGPESDAPPAWSDPEFAAYLAALAGRAVEVSPNG